MRSLSDFYHDERVVARCDIADNPLSRTDSSARKGDVGYIDDIDTAGELLMVDFGHGSIACLPSELTY